MNWIMNRLFGPMIDFVMAWMPMIWLGLGVIVMGVLFFGYPLLFKKLWRPLFGLIVAVFVVLWVVKHYAGVQEIKDQVVTLQAEKATLVQENEQITGQLVTERKTSRNLQTSIDNQAVTIRQLEANSRQIRRDITAARQGLDSATITQETQDDPVQAAVDLSARWNGLGGMFDDSTAGVAASGRSADPAPSAGPSNPN